MPEPTSTKSTKNDIAVTSDSLFFLSNMLENLIKKRDSYDMRASFIVSISSVLFILSLGNLLNQQVDNGKLGFLVICASSLCSGVLALFALRPPKIFQGWRRPNNSLLHHSNIHKFAYDKIARKLKDIVKSNDKMMEQYIIAIHHITEKAIIRKKYFLIPATNFLIGGLIIGLVVVFYLP